jgi:hypothetical protein
MFILQTSVACYENNTDAFVPELWANEGLAILEENMVMANLVHRDFSAEVANFGDVVNTRRPGAFKVKRKVDADSIALQDATTDDVRVPLDQHFYISFTIKDGEASKSFQDLVQVYLAPAMQGIARGVDRALCGQVHKFLANRVGKLGGLSSANAKDYLLEGREKLNKNLAYPSGRNMVLAPSSETAMLQTQLFTAANERGDQGQALREAALGRVFGFDSYMAQNQPGITITNADVKTGIATNAEAIGATLIEVNMAQAVVAGEFITVENDMQPVYATNSVANTSITLSEGLKYASGPLGVPGVNATVTQYNKVDCDGAYATGYSKGITVDGYTAGKVPQVGQLIATGTGTSRCTYTIIEAYENPANANQTIIWLDRPLDVAGANLVDNQDMFPGPAGALNLLFHRDALAFVSRPLALPNSAFGVRSAVASYNNIAMRVTMQYDITTQGTIVTCDLLGGVALLDLNLGCVLLG